MEISNMEVENANNILTSLLVTLENLHVPEKIYFKHWENEMPNNSAIGHINVFGINEQPLPNILHLLGIRSLTIDATYNIGAFSNLTINITNAQIEQYKWHYFKTEPILKELRTLFENCYTIAFDNWSETIGASDLLDGLLTDVIKPIGKKDLEYIFYLGESVKKISFLVEEALDIISDFSFHGQVTFALDKIEAAELWAMLTNVGPSTIAAKKLTDLKNDYAFIFKRMSIAKLLIYSVHSVILFSKQKPIELAQKKVGHSEEMGEKARQNFIEGFSIGLLLKLDTINCVALGLVASGVHNNKTTPKQEDFFAYINTWLKDLQA